MAFRYRPAAINGIETAGSNRRITGSSTGCRIRSAPAIVIGRRGGRGSSRSTTGVVIRIRSRLLCGCLLLLSRLGCSLLLLCSGLLIRCFHRAVTGRVARATAVTAGNIFNSQRISSAHVPSTRCDRRIPGCHSLYIAIGVHRCNVVIGTRPGDRQIGRIFGSYRCIDLVGITHRQDPLGVVEGDRLDLFGSGS